MVEVCSVPREGSPAAREERGRLTRFTLPLTIVVVAVALTCTQQPLKAATAPPSGLTATVTGSTVVLRWSLPFGAIAVRLEAGTFPRGLNAANAVIGATTSYVATNVPPGTYYVRVRAIDSMGESATSNEITVVVGVASPTPSPSPAPVPPPTPAPTPVRTLQVWGGPGYVYYLGYFTCVFCTEYGSDSINNRYSRYGTSYSPTSVRNPNSTYGSPYNTYSACNRYASNPPRIYDAAGNYYGELTLNAYRPQAAPLLDWLYYDVCN
jgi:hypothetical protein